MKKTFLLLCVLFGVNLLAATLSAKPKSSVSPFDLRCEYLKNPKGVDVPQPRLGWLLKATDTHAFGQQQTAYRVLIASTASLLAKENGDVWDSGWIVSDEMQHIPYGGKKLQSDRTYHWKVQVKDEQGTVSAWSESAFWTTGLFDPSE